MRRLVRPRLLSTLSGGTAPAPVPWTSPRGRALFREALSSGTLESYFPLAAQFLTESGPSPSGLGALAMTLNALNIDPGRVWKGPWRWFTEAMLECCVPASALAARSISLDEFAQLARSHGAAARVVRADGDDAIAGAAALRAAVRETTATAGGGFVVASFSRGAVGQLDVGSADDGAAVPFALIAGFHAPADAVLLLDVARTRFPPAWVPVRALHGAMRAQDAALSALTPSAGPSARGIHGGWVTVERGGVNNCAETLREKNRVTDTATIPLPRATEKPCLSHAA